MANGVSFVDAGGEKLIGTTNKPTPYEPSGRGDGGLKFVDSGNSDIDNTAYGTSERTILDDSSHDTTGGPDFHQVGEE